jgi:hypothetical protein
MCSSQLLHDFLLFQGDQLVPARPQPSFLVGFEQGHPQGRWGGDQEQQDGGGHQGGGTGWNGKKSQEYSQRNRGEYMWPVWEDLQIQEDFDPFLLFLYFEFFVKLVENWSAMSIKLNYRQFAMFHTV